MLEEISNKTKGMQGKVSVTFIVGHSLPFPKQPPLSVSCVSLQRYFGKTVLRLLKKLKMELPYDPAIPSWVYIRKKTKT